MRRKLWLVLFVLFFLSLPALAQGDTPKAEPMTVAQAAVIVAGIILFLKMKLIPTLWDKLGSAVHFGITILTSVGVVLYKYLGEGLALNIGAIWFLVEVIIAATSGYLAARALAPGISRSLSKAGGGK